MFEKLLSLLLHAKSGAVATVLVLGTTGALVTATVDNGMTTITITQPSTTTTGSETTTPDGSTTTTTNTTVTEAILALFTRTKAEDDPTGTATGNGCSDEAHARNEQMKAVNDHSKTVRQIVKELSKDASRTGAVRTLVNDADEAIKDIRQAAVKAMHATFDCDKDDDEDEDNDEDEDEDDDEDEDEDEDEDNASTTTTTGPSVAFSGDDAKAIADLAITAMDFQVTNLRAELATEATTPTANTERDDKKSDSDKRDNKGKGNGRDRQDDDEDDD